MTPQSELEIQGNFVTHPFAELLAEIAQARLTGSLRVSNKERKCVVYFKSGLVVFAASNARSSRLFDILLRREKLSKDDLAQVPNFANDFELAAFLQDKGFLTNQECDRLFSEQIETIIVDIFSWDSGDWTFSSLARIRDGLAYPVNSTKVLADYSRCMNTDKMLSRFRSLEESFSRSAASELHLDLGADEAFVLSRANEGPLTATGLIAVAAMPEVRALHAIYTLWLSGLLIRDDWQPAFSAASVNAMRNAKLEIKTEARVAGVPPPVVVEEKPVEIEKPTAPKAPEITISLEEYLERVENAETYYDILDVDPKADIEELKRSYFSLARNFHPDRYHAEGGETLRRVQHAFTELAQAHETLKNDESREMYDYRIRKELAEREKLGGKQGNASLQAEQARENFDRGFGLLMENRAADALPFLARAAHFAPKNARYRAYYGKALSFDDKQRHKAESEMQAAVRIDATNPTFRLLLAEFFVQVNLPRRAEGELTRLLAIFPSNREGREMLDSLRAKQNG